MWRFHSLRFNKLESLGKVHDLGPKNTGDVTYQGQMGMKGSFNMTHDIDDKLEVLTQYHP